MPVGKRLQLVMKELDIKQVELSKLLDIDQSYISMLINGKREISKLLALSLQNLYNINPTWLLTGKGEMFLKPRQKDLIANRQVEDTEANLPEKIKHLVAHKGHAETYPQVDDVDKIAHTGWWDKIGNTRQYIVAALDELSTPEYLEKLKNFALEYLRRERFDRNLQKDLEERESELRKKGETA